MLDVLERYARLVPDNKLEAYIPRLQSLAKNWSESTVGLAGLPEAWREAAADPVFREIQDEVVNQQYYQRAENYAQRIGAIEPLTLLLLYDAILQHGYGSDPDGLPELIRCTNRQLDGTPRDGVDEYLWAAQFLRQRRSSLLNAHNASTRSVWADSVGRVDTLAQLLDSGQTRLDQPIVVNPWGTEFILLPAGYH
jgi:chitosanase